MLATIFQRYETWRATIRLTIWCFRALSYLTGNEQLWATMKMDRDLIHMFILRMGSKLWTTLTTGWDLVRKSTWNMCSQVVLRLFSIFEMNPDKSSEELFEDPIIRSVSVLLQTWKDPFICTWFILRLSITLCAPSYLSVVLEFSDKYRMTEDSATDDPDNYWETTVRRQGIKHSQVFILSRYHQTVLWGDSSVQMCLQGHLSWGFIISWSSNVLGALCLYAGALWKEWGFGLLSGFIYQFWFTMSLMSCACICIAIDLTQLNFRLLTLVWTVYSALSLHSSVVGGVLSCKVLDHDLLD